GGLRRRLTQNETDGLSQIVTRFKIGKSAPTGKQAQRRVDAPMESAPKATTPQPIRQMRTTGTGGAALADASWQDF
ncbi:MAG: hypothetical protein KAG89_11065, partial [Fulvimarina manganoxydans]|nr:hypothetical protein [Fulvimarina manganoxydans]